VAVGAVQDNFSLLNFTFFFFPTELQIFDLLLVEKPFKCFFSFTYIKLLMKNTKPTLIFLPPFPLH